MNVHTTETELRNKIDLLKLMLSKIVYDHEYGQCQFCGATTREEEDHKSHCLYARLVLDLYPGGLEEVLFLLGAQRGSMGAAGYELKSVSRVQNPLSPLMREIWSKNGRDVSFLYGGGEYFQFEGYADEIE